MLFSEIAYGPIHSRRLGISLGMEIMPLDQKWCTFDCVYCECGWNQPLHHPQLPTREAIREALETKLQVLGQEGVRPDVITFSGNGEPTLHPDFEGIIDDTCMLRDRYCPQAKVSVLSNATQLERADVVAGLRKADNRILKMDSAIEHTMRLIDQPANPAFSVERLLHNLAKWEGDFTLQTCFLRGEYHGEKIDNTTPEELQAWYAAVERIRPKQVMIYVIDRKTPLETLEKVSREEMEAIAAPLRAKGYEVSVSA